MDLTCSHKWSNNICLFNNMRICECPKNLSPMAANSNLKIKLDWNWDSNPLKYDCGRDLTFLSVSAHMLLFIWLSFYIIWYHLLSFDMMRKVGLGLKFGTAQGDFISKSKLLEVKRIVGQWKHEVGGIFTLLDFVQVIQTGLCSEQWFACGLAVSVSS